MGKRTSAHVNGSKPSDTKKQIVPPPTDIELINQAQADGQDAGQMAGRRAFAELVNRHSSALLRYLGNLLPRPDLAEGAAQEVFLATCP